MADLPAGRPILGDGAMLAAMVLLPVADALSKIMAADHSAEQIAWIRYLVHAGIVLPLAWRSGLTPGPVTSHLLRSLAFVLMTVLYVVALSRMPLADAQAVFFTYPLMVMGYAALVHDRRLDGLRWFAAIAGLAGLLLVVRPWTQGLSPGAGLALLAALAGAVHVVMTRRMSGGVPDIALLATPVFFAALILAPAVPWRWVTPDLADLAIMVAIGVLSAAIQLLLIVAYARAEPSTIAPLAYVQILVGILLGRWIFGDFPDALGAAGIALIVLSGIVIAVRERDVRPDG